VLCALAYILVYEGAEGEGGRNELLGIYSANHFDIPYSSVQYSASPRARRSRQQLYKRLRAKSAKEWHGEAS